MSDPTPNQDVIDVRDDEGFIASEFRERISEAISEGNRKGLDALTRDLHEADLADLIESLKPDQRESFVRLQKSDFNMLALTEVDDAVRDQILDIMPVERVAEGVRALDTDDAVSILEDLGEEEQSEILEQIPEVERTALKRSLDYPEDSAGRRMQTGFISVPPYWTVGQTIDHMRDTDNLPEEFYEIFVIDPAFRPIGTVTLSRVMRTQRPVPLQDIVEDDFYTVLADDDQEEVARTFERYDLVSAAVTDESGRLVGVITVDDIIDVIEEEADEDIRRLAGVGDEEMSDSVFDIARSRFTWLLVNLGTAILASFVIQLFDATIEQMVALAVLMPIVASMGGNAGTQTMTVAVRALATGDLSHLNMRRVVTREAVVGFLNGCVFAVVMGWVVLFWFGDGQLGLVIGAAMIINMLAAGLFGIFVPVALDKMEIDPAIASGPFVTTVTDVVGFFAFLGLAAFWLGLT